MGKTRGKSVGLQRLPMQSTNLLVKSFSEGNWWQIGESICVLGLRKRLEVSSEFIPDAPKCG